MSEPTPAAQTDADRLAEIDGWLKFWLQAQSSNHPMVTHKQLKEMDWLLSLAIRQRTLLDECAEALEYLVTRVADEWDPTEDGEGLVTLNLPERWFVIMGAYRSLLEEIRR